MDFSLFWEKMDKVTNAAEHAEYLKWLAGEIKPSDFEQVRKEAFHADAMPEVSDDDVMWMMCFAVCYLFGIGVEADMERTCYWMTSAGYCGCGAACYWHGERLIKCKDDCQSVKEAIEWFERAERYEYANAESRRRYAACRLSFLKRLGDG
ncbi:MAG: sel1 repeat family protein [Bacteroidaceae bacterium]|nr:sel1 repeat family protein [Bacteroidaceae bacterium]